MARRTKPIDISKAEPICPLLKYRITRHGQDPIYVEANEINVYSESLIIERNYTSGYSVNVCSYAEGEWEKVELVEVFPEET